MIKTAIRLISACSLVLAMTLTAAARSKQSEQSDSGKEAERALAAANVLREFMNTPESNIPEELMNHAHAIAVIPNVVKAAFGVGGSHGKGLVTRRTNDHSWGTPAFIDLNGGSFGFQLGVSVTDLILVFTNEDGLKGLFEDKVELGGSAGVAAGPIGRSAEAGTNLTFDSPIYSYSRSKGLFAGVALKGTVMTIDDSSNHRVYGANVSGRDILLQGNVKSTADVKPFLVAVSQEAPRLEGAAEPKRQVSTVPPVGADTKVPRKTSLAKSDAKQAQEALRAKGYYHGSIDGIVGPATRKAIKEYQKNENLPVNGRLDSETADKLGVKEESVAENFAAAGQQVAQGSREAGHEIKKGKPVAAGKEFGKGVGRSAEKIGKGVAEAVDPDSSDEKK